MAANYKWARNLKKSQLGGVIFGCTKNTMGECLSSQLFGLPGQHFLYVQNIEPGLPLFLFSYSDKKLHGIFEATSSGKMNINSYAWTNGGSGKTQFPAQVQIRVHLKCQALSEDQFKPIIADNYYTQNHFRFELDHVQVTKLISVFSSLTVGPGSWISKSPSKSLAVVKRSPSNENVEGIGPSDPTYSNANDFLGISADSDGSQSCDRNQLKEASPCNQMQEPDEKGIIYVKLFGEIEELKEFKQEYTLKVASLEKKLVEAKQQINQLEYRCMILESTSNPLVTFARESPMLNLNLDQSIFLVGGYDGVSWLSALDYFSPSHDVLSSLKPMSSVRAHASVAKLGGELYVLGGSSGSVWWCDTVESYSVVKNQWTLCPSLNKEKGSLAAATLDGKLFALGGGNGSECFSDVEMFDPNIGRWISARSMLQQRFSLAAVECHGAIYAVGGYDGNNYLKSAERFDPREHSWSSISDMDTKRGCHSLVVLNDKLYVIGGYDGIDMASSIEIYDPRLGTWMPGEAMNLGRGYSAAALVDNSIFVIGGVVESGNDITDLMECYKEGEGWEAIKSRAVGKRCFASAIVLRNED